VRVERPGFGDPVGARIAIVGDTAPAAAARSILGADGHCVRVIAEPAEALEALETEPADLVITEMRTPLLDGAQLCRSIRGHPALAEIHLIALTSRAEGERAGIALEAGADDYLPKPFEEDELVARVRLGLRAASLRASEAQLWALIENVPGAIYRCAHDRDWTMELISREIEQIAGYPSTDFIRNACRSFASVIHPEDCEAVERTVEDAVARGRPFAMEYRIRRGDGTERWVLERGQLVRGNDGRSWLDGVIFDVTERRAAEESLRRQEAERARHHEVRASRARLVEAGDRARRRLERDLHDGAQQRLVSLALSLRLARARVEPDPIAAARMLGEASAELKLATAELRDLARGLHPAVLSDRGLGPALEGLVDRAPLPVSLEVEVSSRLPSAVEAAAYFVVSEALTNVAKHACATTATVTVGRGNGEVVVEVSDDGVGGLDAAAGSGLSGLEDRVAALDGALETQSGAGGGTRVRAVLPCG